jgi:hypothetical protein
MLKEYSRGDFSCPNDTSTYRIIEANHTKKVKNQNMVYALIAISEEDHRFKRKTISASAENEITSSTNDVNKSPIRGISVSDIT